MIINTEFVSTIEENCSCCVTNFSLEVVCRALQTAIGSKPWTVSHGFSISIMNFRCNPILRVPVGVQVYQFVMAGRFEIGIEERGSG